MKTSKFQTQFFKGNIKDIDTNRLTSGVGALYCTECSGRRIHCTDSGRGNYCTH